MIIVGKRKGVTLKETRERHNRAPKITVEQKLQFLVAMGNDQLNREELNEIGSILNMTKTQVKKHLDRLAEQEKIIKIPDFEDTRRIYYVRK